MLELTVLTVPDCPNGPVLEERLAQVLAAGAGRGGPAVRVTHRLVESLAEAERYGMHGSPTLLVDGVDPFADRDAPPSLACRLSHALPSVAALREAVERAGRERQDTVGRAGRGRVAPVEGGLRAVHQRVLRGFAETGRAPSTAELDVVAAPYGLDAGSVLARLHAEDFLRLEGSEIRAAYPFSAVPTPHAVRIAAGPRVYAMCAIDALGTAAMLGAEVTIASTDPTTGATVTVRVHPDGSAIWQPTTAVVFAGRRADCATCADEPGAAADVSCSAINFFATTSTARRWAREHPDITGKVLDQTNALHLAVQTFSQCLTPTSAPCGGTGAARQRGHSDALPA